MKKLLCLTSCALLAASAIVSAQNAKQDSKKPTKKSSVGQDPFGGGANADPFGDGDNVDPFSDKKTDPFAPKVDPFGNPVAKPDNAAGTDPFGDGAEPFSDGGRGAAKRKQQSSKPEAEASLAAPRNYFVVPIRGSSDARRRIEAILAQEAKFEYLDAPLTEVIEDIQYSHHLPIVFDRRALDDFGIDTSTPISINLEGISLKSALRLMLHDLVLTYMIQDEVLLITTSEVAEAQSLVALYPLSKDLVGDHDGEWLVEVITSVVAPETWTDAGGSASVVYVPHLRMLAVRQTSDILAEIGKLINTLEEVAKARSRKQS